MVELGEEKRPSSKKWLLGCGGGCLGTIMLVAVALGLIAYYAMRAVPILPPETFLVRQTDGFVVAKITKDDEAIIRELQKVLTRLPELTDMSKDTRRNWRQQQANAKEALVSAGPVQVTVVQQVSPDGEAKRGMVANIKRLSGFFRWTVNWSLDSLPAEGGSLEDYQGTTIGTSKEGMSVAARGNNFMFSQSSDVIKHWIDRIKEQRKAESEASEKEAPAPSPQLSGKLKELYNALPQAVPVRFGLSNEASQLKKLMSTVAREAALEDLEELGVFDQNIEALSGTAETESGSTGKVSLTLACKGAPVASEIAGRLKKEKSQLEQALQIQKLQVEQDDSELKVDFLVPDMWSRLRKALTAGLKKETKEEKQDAGRE